MLTKSSFGRGPRVFASEAEVDDAVYLHDNRIRISDTVRACTNVELVKRIDAMLAAEKTTRF